MAVDDDIRAVRDALRRDVNEEETHAFKPQIHFNRPRGPVIVITADDAHWFAGFVKRVDGRRVAHIAEMPDFIDVGENIQDLTGKAIVSIRDNPDGDHLFLQMKN